MKFKSALLTSTSGSIGGMTGSHNRSGMYLRARAIPVNPNSSRQIDTRAALTAAVGAWGGTTQLIRDAWNLYASNVPVTNALGDSVQLSGQNMYVRSYTSLIQSGGTPDPAGFAAPTIFDLGQGPMILDTTAIDVSTGISLQYDVDDAWNSSDPGTLLVYAGRPQSPGVNFFKGPWRYVGNVETGSTPPEVFAVNPFPVSPGQKQWLAFRVLYADNRLSSQTLFGPKLTVA